MLDTNAVSAFFDGEKEVVDRIDLTSILYLPTTVIGEFSYGALKSAFTNDGHFDSVADLVRVGW